MKIKGDIIKKQKKVFKALIIAIILLCIVATVFVIMNKEYVAFQIGAIRYSWAYNYDYEKELDKLGYLTKKGAIAVACENVQKEGSNKKVKINVKSCSYIDNIGENDVIRSFISKKITDCWRVHILYEDEYHGGIGEKWLIIHFNTGEVLGGMGTM